MHEANEVSLRRQLTFSRAAMDSAGSPSCRERQAHIAAIERIVKGHSAQIEGAIAADFGYRCARETRLIEIFPTLQAARFARRHLARWMAPRGVPVAPYFRPGRARIVWQPAGVVGIVVPWNYPLLLAFGPLIGALAAGNRAIIKMSERSARTAELLARIASAEFSPDRLTIVAGGDELGKAFAALPFDHLLFTGSTAAGRGVMRAAADNLTPVTLELGGKCPAIVGRDAPLADAAARIMSGKCRNAGQTCIAPDYVLLPEGATDAFIAAARRCIVERYPALPDSADYTSIAGAAQFERLAQLVADAVSKGATVVPLHPLFTLPDAVKRRMPPLLVVGVRDDMRIMHEEIFGPLLALRTYRTLDDAIAYVNARARPLAVYYFGESAADVEAVLGRTVSGAACINDVMVQFAQEALPFGGVGASGMGAYHGRTGFETFARKKAVFEQAKSALSDLLEPPYGRRFDLLVRFLNR